MAFGNPYKYVQLKLNKKEMQNWNHSVIKSDDRFNGEEHNIFL